jgi:hypothetical protein
MADGAKLRLAINLGRDVVRFPTSGGRQLFALKEPGSPASFSAELAP